MKTTWWFLIAITLALVSALPKKRGGGSSRRKSYSRSPMSARRRHVGSREKPEEGTCLGVFGLSLYTTERELDKEFSKFGPLQKVQVVLDGKVSIVNV